MELQEKKQSCEVILVCLDEGCHRREQGVV